MNLRAAGAMKDAPPRMGQPAGRIPPARSGLSGPVSSVPNSWVRRAANELRGLAWSPMTWILLGLFAMAEVGNWEMGDEIARVCELLEQGEIASAPPNLSRTEIDDICRNRSPRDHYRPR